MLFGLLHAAGREHGQIQCFPPKLSQTTMHDAGWRAIGLGGRFPDGDQHKVDSTLASLARGTPAICSYARTALYTQQNKDSIAISIYSMAQQPDLQAILATLAQYSQQSKTEPPRSQEPYQPTQSDHVTPSVPANSNLSAVLQNTRVESISADPRLRGRPQSRSVTPSQPPKQDQTQPPSVIDPATITVWQDGLRCVTKIAAQNKMFEATIRRVSPFC